MPDSRPPFGALNLSIVVGRLSREPELRTIPAGAEVLSLELTVRQEGLPAESVPVSWPSPPAAAVEWSIGEEVLVVGRVRRRFFRTGGITQSRTEVVAASAVPTRRGAAARKVLDRALEGL